MADSESQTPDWIRLSPELEHFDPFEGLVDFSETEKKDIRYGYKICNMNLLFDPKIPCEIISNENVFSIPNTPKWIKGLINHRGNLIPVFDLYKLWTLEKPQKQLPLLIFDRNEDFIALYSDAFPLALETKHAKINSTDPGTDLPAEIIQFKNISYSIDNSIWHEIDLKGFMKYITRDFADNDTADQGS